MAHVSGNPPWQDYPLTTTPVTAAALEKIESAVDVLGSPPVTSVNSKTGAVVLTASDVGAAKASATVTNSTATSYNVQAIDVGTVLTVSNAAGVTVALPADLTATIPIGASLTIINIGTGALSIRGSSGGAVVNGVLGPTVISPTYPRWSKVVAVKIDADTWIVG